MSNTFIVNLKTGKVEAKNLIQVTHRFKCECGNDLTATLEWPEGLSVNGSITIPGTKCPQCNEPGRLPTGKYRVEGYSLINDDARLETLLPDNLQ